MARLVLQLRLALSLLFFLIQLGWYTVVTPRLSFWVVLLFSLYLVGWHTVQMPLTAPQTSTVTTQLADLLISPALQAAGYQTELVSLVDLRARETSWKLQHAHFPHVRDVLLQGYFLYQSLGDAQQAEDLLQQAIVSDPNNAIFSELRPDPTR